MVELSSAREAIDRKVAESDATRKLVALEEGLRERERALYMGPILP